MFNVNPYNAVALTYFMCSVDIFRATVEASREDDI